MLKIDPRAGSDVEAFGLIALYGCLTGSITLVVRDTLRNVKGFLQLRMLFKDYLYKAAKLRPRNSDPDYMGLSDESVLS